MTVTGQVDLKLHLSVGQVILFPYFDHCASGVLLASLDVPSINENSKMTPIIYDGSTRSIKRTQY